MQYEFFIPSADLELIWKEWFDQRVPRPLRLGTSLKATSLDVDDVIQLFISDKPIGNCRVVEVSRVNQTHTVTLFPLKSSWLQSELAEQHTARSQAWEAMQSPAFHKTTWEIVEGD